jgi:hypothetical protein
MNQNTITMYETMILVIDVEPFCDGRKVCERLQNQKFDSYTDFLTAVKSELDSEIEDETSVQLWTLSDFMDVCNDEEMNLINVWIGYVQIKSL